MGLPFHWVSEIAMFFQLCLGLVYRVCMMFSVGEKLKQIKLACTVDCAIYFYKKKEYQKAISCYQEALRLDPNDYYANVGLTATLVANKSFRESLERR